MASISSTAHTTLPEWQADESVQSCPLCASRFTWYHRKHHCRKCGRVVCNNCCSNFYSLPAATVVRAPDHLSPAFLSPLPFTLDEESPDGLEEVRTCDGCFSKLEQDRCRRMLGLDIQTLDPRDAAQLIRDSIASSAVPASPPPSYTRASLLRGITGSQTQGEAGPVHGGLDESSNPRSMFRVMERAPRWEHAASSSAPTSRHRGTRPRELSVSDSVVPLRYVSFEMNEQDKMCGDECPICFEEYESGQKIARLECWCVFHLSCIRAWKSQKAGTGGCPLHFHD